MSSMSFFSIHFSITFYYILYAYHAKIETICSFTLVRVTSRFIMHQMQMYYYLLLELLDVGQPNSLLAISGYPDSGTSNNT
jgi:hypothetical protein